MKPTSFFDLEKHEGEYSTWPFESRLIVSGKMIKTKVPGYDLLISLQLDNGNFILVTDYNCPFEEETTAILLNPDYKVISKLRFPDGVLIDRSTVDILSNDSFRVSTFGSGEFIVKIKEKRRFFWHALFEIKQTSA